MLNRKEDLSIDEDTLKEELAILLPNEDPDRLFEVIVGWGRYGELFGYNADEKIVYLDTGSAEEAA
jgi:hypothetical protein